MFNSSIRLLGNISEKTINLVKPLTKSVRSIPNAFAIGYTQSKINRNARKQFVAMQAVEVSNEHQRPKQSEIDFA